MQAATTFSSEAFKEGQVYLFDATAHEKHWSAVIWGPDGRMHGEITCEYLGPRLEGDALEDAVSDWVHEAIRCGVGIF